MLTPPTATVQICPSHCPGCRVETAYWKLAKVAGMEIGASALILRSPDKSNVMLVKTGVPSASPFCVGTIMYSSLNATTLAPELTAAYPSACPEIAPPLRSLISPGLELTAAFALAWIEVPRLADSEQLAAMSDESCPLEPSSVSTDLT
jgi:hypothetical protein